MMHRRRGFTLIEVLVVLIIVVIITAVAVIAFGQFGRGRRERIVAEQFSRVIKIAQQQAILTPAVLGLNISAKGYHFYQYARTSAGKSTWQSLHNDVLSNPHAFQQLFNRHVKNASQPTILFLPSGFVTPFVLKLNGSAHTFLITVKNNGIVETHEKK